MKREKNLQLYLKAHLPIPSENFYEETDTQQHYYCTSKATEEQVPTKN